MQNHIRHLLFGCLGALLFWSFACGAPDPGKASCQQESDCQDGFTCVFGTCVASSSGTRNTRATEPNEMQPGPDDGGAVDGVSPEVSEPISPEGSEPTFPDNPPGEPITPDGDVTCQEGETRPCISDANTFCQKDDSGDDDDNSFECKGTCAPGTQTCQNARWSACEGEILSADEICDGQDNDCDGKIDNATGAEDNTLTVQCFTGDPAQCEKPDNEKDFKCTPPCKAGVRSCNNGKLGECAGEITGEAESCDKADNDCDGRIDEDFPLSQACKVGIGACAVPGKNICAKDGKSTTCDATPKQAKAEICDGEDNDCDGAVDNKPGDKNNYTLQKECFPAILKGCTLDVQSNKWSCLGICRTGIQTCKSTGGFSTCVGVVEPKPQDKCDNKDNDCDGDTDEDCVCTDGLMQACGTCGKGTQTCTNNSWGPCMGDAIPSTETCDNKDNDCDGTIDEAPGTGRPRTLQQSCYPKGENGCVDVGTRDYRCVGTCVAGVQTCTSGKWELAACEKATIPTTEICDVQDNDCDGTTDEQLAPQYSYSGNRGCTPRTDGTFDCQGICKPQIKVCNNGRYDRTQQEVLPAPEYKTCFDQRDNDCDGKVDYVDDARTLSDTSSCRDLIYLIHQVSNTPGQMVIHDIKTNAAGGIYLLLELFGQLSFPLANNQQVTLGTANTATGYLIKINAARKIVWHMAFGTPSTSQSGVVPRRMALSQGDIFVTGVFLGTADFPINGPTGSSRSKTLQSTQVRNNGSLVPAASAFVWAVRDPSPNNVSTPYNAVPLWAISINFTQYAEGTAIVADGTRVIVGGAGHGTFQGQTTQRVDPFLTTLNPTNGAHLKTLLWTTGTMVTTDGNDRIWDLKLLQNDLMVAGTFSGEIKPQGTNTPTLKASGRLDAFLARLDPSLNTVHWVDSIHSRDNDVIIAMESTANGDLYLIGASENQSGPTPTRTTFFDDLVKLPNPGRRNGFVVRLQPDRVAPKIQWKRGLSYANQARQKNHVTPTALQWHDSKLHVVGSMIGRLDVFAVAPGVLPRLTRNSLSPFSVTFDNNGTTPSTLTFPGTNQTPRNPYPMLKATSHFWFVKAFAFGKYNLDYHGFWYTGTLQSDLDPYTLFTSSIGRIKGNQIASHSVLSIGELPR